MIAAFLVAVMCVFVLNGTFSQRQSESQPFPEVGSDEATGDVIALSIPGSSEAVEAANISQLTERILLRRTEPGIPEFADSKELKPRVPLPKREPRSPEGTQHQLMVKFADSLQARSDEVGRLSLKQDRVSMPLVELVEEFGQRRRDFRLSKLL